MTIELEFDEDEVKSIIAEHVTRKGHVVHVKDIDVNTAFGLCIQVEADKRRSMYKGKSKFDYEQLVFMIEAAMCAAFDKIDGALPPTTGMNDFLKDKQNRLDYISTCVSVVGIFVPIIYAQITGHGMGGEDFEGWAEFKEMVEKHIKKSTNPKTFKKVTSHPDCRKVAETIVRGNFHEYLNDTN